MEQKHFIEKKEELNRQDEELIDKFRKECEHTDTIHFTGSDRYGHFKMILCLNCGTTSSSSDKSSDESLPIGISESYHLWNIKRENLLRKLGIKK